MGKCFSWKQRLSTATQRVKRISTKNEEPGSLVFSLVLNLTQQDLAQRIGCSQPAISQMLNRKCRPQKNTILKLAEALDVQPQELWPDLEVADLLDAVPGFQRDDYVMTEAEAESLRNTSRRNPSEIPVRSLPARRR